MSMGRWVDRVELFRPELAWHSERFAQCRHRRGLRAVAERATNLSTRLTQPDGHSDGRCEFPGRASLSMAGLRYLKQARVCRTRTCLS